MMGEGGPGGKQFPGMLYLYLEDVDAVYQRAIQAGGKSLSEPANRPYGDRYGGVEDAFGNQWWISSHVEVVTSEELERRAKAAKGQGQILRLARWFIGAHRNVCRRIRFEARLRAVGFDQPHFTTSVIIQ
jgi:hypothetical protein